MRITNRVIEIPVKLDPITEKKQDGVCLFGSETNIISTKTCQGHTYTQNKNNQPTKQTNSLQIMNIKILNKI